MCCWGREGREDHPIAPPKAMADSCAEQGWQGMTSSTRYQRKGRSCCAPCRAGSRLQKRKHAPLINWCLRPHSSPDQEVQRYDSIFGGTGCWTVSLRAVVLQLISICCSHKMFISVAFGDTSACTPESQQTQRRKQQHPSKKKEFFNRFQLIKRHKGQGRKKKGEGEY